MTRMDLHVDPEDMCDQHLLGNHNETHQLVGFVRNGAWRKLVGHAARGQIDLTRLESWHDRCARAMVSRGFEHDSELCFDLHLPIGQGSIGPSSTGKLPERCSVCGTNTDNYE